jgi:hypothetical protein
MDWLIGSLFYNVLIDVFGYSMARLVCPFFRLIGYTSSLSVSETKFNALGYSHDGKGRMEIESTVAGFLGLIIFLIVFLLIRVCDLGAFLSASIYRLGRNDGGRTARGKLANFLSSAWFELIS